MNSSTPTTSLAAVASAESSGACDHKKLVDDQPLGGISLICKTHPVRDVKNFSLNTMSYDTFKERIAYSIQNYVTQIEQKFKQTGFLNHTFTYSAVNEMIGFSDVLREVTKQLTAKEYVVKVSSVAIDCTHQQCTNCMVKCNVHTKIKPSRCRRGIPLDKFCDGSNGGCSSRWQFYCAHDHGSSSTGHTRRCMRIQLEVSIGNTSLTDQVKINDLIEEESDIDPSDD